jgi:hypothetical protein
MARSKSAGTGCLGMAGMVFLAMVAMCSDGDEYRTPEPLLTGQQSYAASTPPAAPEDFYLHGELNVRTGPGQDYPRVRTLSRGERVRLGPKAADGWAELYSAGWTSEGYVYRGSDLVRSYAPRARPAPAPSPQHEIPTGDGYVNSRGNRVRSPVYSSSAPAGASARCRDGTYSFSQSRRGTCSHHGGVASWL